MSTIMYYICYPLGYLMKWCFEFIGNYGLAVILFTFLTKIVIMPISVWVHMNSIKMVRIQPQINFIKAKYYGDKDRIAEEETNLYKTAKYNPFASIVPMLVQILLLMCVVVIIKEPLTHILHLSDDVCKVLASQIGVDFKEGQLSIVQSVLNGTLTPDMFTGAAAEAIDSIKTLNLSFVGFGLDVVPYEVWGKYILVPAIAGISSLILCFAQNSINVLQAEQSKLNKYGMTAFSVGISLSLGFFVYTGVALYWVASNLLAILQQFVLNAIINPKKYVDYDELEKSRKALSDIEALGGDKKSAESKANAKREKADYKRFFKIVNKHLVIYSEKSGFYKYFEAIITGLLSRSNITIHYVTNDPDDAIFELAKSEPRIRPYYIGQKKLITLMMKMDADIVVMTTPDLEKFYIKRSLVRKDVKYIYIPHDMMSIHMGFREGALDHFDTVFCTGPHAVNEIRETEKVYGLNEKTLVEFGYPLTEKLIASYENTEKSTNAKKEILIAPSWQADNLLDSCIDQLISGLVCDEYHVTVRPHPEYVKRYPEKMELITEKYKDISDEKLSFELDFTSNRSTYSSDLLITDWSGIAYEFCFATKKPALFVNTEMKVTNPEWQRISAVPREIYLRDKVGISLDKNELCDVKKYADELLAEPEKYREKISDILNSYLFNIGSNGAFGVKYILDELKDIQAKKKNENTK